VVGSFYLGGRDTIRWPSLIEQACVFRSRSFIVLLSLQPCLTQSAQKNFLGGVLPTEFSQCGLKCSQSPLPYRDISQSINGVIAFSYSSGCRFWICAAI
jgi:hypothetical protein